MYKAVKEAGFKQIVENNKVPIAAGGIGMALAAILSKKNKLAKMLAAGAAAGGAAKAGQMYLDAYRSSKGTVPDYLKRQSAKAQESGLNTDLPGVSPRIQAAIAAARLPIAGSVPDYLKRQPVKAQESGFNPTLPGVSPRIQAAIAAGKLPTREDRQKAREKELAALQSEGYGSQFLKNMVTGTGEALKEMATSSAAPVVDLYNRAKGDIGALNKAAGHNKEAEKNIRRMRDELEARNAPRRKETLLDRVMRSLSK